MFRIVSLCSIIQYQGEDSPDEDAWQKLEFIPEKYMGTVIGKNRENLNKIEQKTGATLMVRGWNGLHVKRSPKSQKRAIREIKEQVVSLAVKVIRTAAVYHSGPSLYLV